MKNLGIITVIMLLTLMWSCNSNTEPDTHVHDDGTVHTDDEHATETTEAATTHTHDDGTVHADDAHATETTEAATTHTHDDGTVHADDAHATETPEAATTHTHDDGTVHEDEPAATSASNIDPNAYKSVQVVNRNFHFVKKTSGQIILNNKGEASITAKTAGVVRFKNQLMFPGVDISAGQILFTIGGESLTENNIGLNLAKIESDYNLAKANYDRASSLIEDKLITLEHYLSAKNEYEKAKAEYDVFSSSSNGDVSIVKAPKKSFLKEILVEEGSIVEAGDKLATIITRQDMVLRVDISPANFEIIDRIKSAKFSTGYNMKVFNTQEMNGSLISYGKSSSDNSFYLPMYFRIDFDNDLIPGTFADVWLIGEEIENAIVIPNGSILEEFGKFYVFIDHGDHFDKRFITPGKSDGSHTQVMDGLTASEAVVTDGVYQVKMSMMTAIPNTHDHSH